MNQRNRAILSVLAVAFISVACGPTNTDIGAKVKANLTVDETAKTAQIDVSVQKKIVTLSGTVDSPAVKERAVAVARGTDGVVEVVDHITVKEQSAGPSFSSGHESRGKGMTEGMNHPTEENRK